MKELSRTIAFVVVAAVSVLGAAGMHWASRPKASADFSEVSKPFYPDFTNPLEAKGLKVAAFDEGTASIKEFEVVFKDGKWRIPSHHDYPADGADRLAKTAASVMEITKDALASPRASDHERFGVLDPLNEESTALKGRGQRITINGENGAVLADYIIGKKVDKREGYYYVRNPKENQTYLARVEINLSTKFGDWIEADLLKLDADKLVEVDVEKYSIDRTAMRIVNPERSKLTREKFSDPWKLDGLNEETEELKADEVRSLVSNLDDLKIVGIRSKPAGLRPDLKIDSKIARNPIARTQLMNSLVDKGFLPVEDQDGNPRLVSTEGEVIASTSEGVEYVLHFGEVFTGSDMEIESGFAKEDDPKKPKDGDKKSDDKAADAKKADGEKSDDPKGSEEDADSKDKKKDGLKKSRYLMVLVQFDERRLGAEPVKPEKPEPGEPAEPKPEAPKEGAEEKKSEEKKPDEKNPDEKKSEDKKAEEGASSGDDDQQDDAAVDDAKKDEKKPEAVKEDEKPAADKPAGTKKPEKKDPAFEARLANYQRDLEKYENDVKLRDDKITEGRKKVEQLNKRFGEWYYVISAESFDSLRLSRSALVKPKEPKPEDGKPGEAKPDDAKPSPKEDGAAAAEAPAKPEPKKDESKPEEKKTDEKPKDE